VEEILDQNIAGSSSAIKSVIKTIGVLSKYQAPILITGETGTGKELAARGLHYSGACSSFPFLAVNCSTFTDDLFVSELFGHKKGAFTDAKNNHVGLLDAADGGSIFLDEIDSLSLRSQAALLRLLQEKEYRSIGSNTIRKANVRIIAATNHDLPELISNGLFREDLYYRLLILKIHMPALRDRLEDIEPLVENFVGKLNSQYSLGRTGVSPKVFRRLYQHDWPGNVRELENTIHRLYLTSEKDFIDEIDASHFVLPNSNCGFKMEKSESPNKSWFNPTNSTFADAKRKAVEDFEHTYVEQALNYTNGNVTRAASLCGKERRAFGKLIKKYNITKQDTEERDSH
jgi:DNA-binding NtrC family response regulator